MDDIPSAHADSNSTTSGHLLTVNAAAGVESNDVFGADGKSGAGVVGVATGSNTSVPVLTGAGTDIVTALGTLHLNTDGSYTYQPKANRWEEGRLVEEGRCWWWAPHYTKKK